VKRDLPLYLITGVFVFIVGVLIYVHRYVLQRDAACDSHKAVFYQNWDVVEPQDGVGPTLYRTCIPGGWLISTPQEELIFVPAKNKDWLVDK
jgi:hypothetical protein